ncbi:outer envelope protein [Azonexus hydrophilus]|jgi:nucleoside-specific outer membrane channel protein Tsx|uniref:Outer envelope protein n=1 Tax=Azonexus hydrophilus TaxID=418702 RepID=A0ABZ2XKL6_9RHOO|nr:outer envelope protein [Azonexus hydrophilus]MBS4017334.1 hypothetical protein [Dechloromonas sp.]
MFAKKSILTASVLLAVGITGASAADWSDTSIGYRYGTKFAEPFNNNDIKKNIINLTHASGYKYGSNYFNVDMLMSDSNDSPTTNGVPNKESSAQEVYIVYRHTFDFGKIAGKSLAVGPFRGFGFTAGFDYNNKSGDSYQSKKRMLVAGPTVMMNVPGFLNISLLQLWESNEPARAVFRQPGRYHYDPHPMLNLAWGIPLGDSGFSFSGYANFIAAKGDNENIAKTKTKAETNIDMALLYDFSGLIGAQKNTFKAGVGYQYWKNKFGNDHKGAAGNGAYAKTPMIRAEYHF